MDIVQTGNRFTNVVGDYVVRVRTHNYSNPSSLLANSSCCDQPCGEPSCDNIFFHYCLKNLGTSYGDGQSCSDGSLINYDDASLNFSQPIVFGLPNPLPLQGPQREWTVSLSQCNNGTRAHTVHMCGARLLP
jgi:hypothetical protein